MLIELDSMLCVKLRRIWYVGQKGMYRQLKNKPSVSVGLQLCFPIGDLKIQVLRENRDQPGSMG